MKLQFWGVRGSIPTPGADTVNYGGNTACIEVMPAQLPGETTAAASQPHFIFDAGTGIHRLALTLPRGVPLTAHIFITHTHWDHIQGLPFFLPLFAPGNDICIYGPHDPVSGQGIEQVMAIQMQYAFFPVREAELRAKVTYRSLAPGEVVEIDGTRITPVLLNHPVVNYGYRIDAHGRSLFYTGDHEPWLNIYPADDPRHAVYQQLIAGREAAIDAVLAGVEVLIADCAYTSAEALQRPGWGHGSFAKSVALAQRLGVGTLFCTHHEPTRDDASLEAVLAETLAETLAKPQTKTAGTTLNVQLAREGLQYCW